MQKATFECVFHFLHTKICPLFWQFVLLLPIPGIVPQYVPWSGWINLGRDPPGSDLIVVLIQGRLTAEFEKQGGWNHQEIADDQGRV